MAYDSEANAPFEHLVRHACELFKQFSESSYRKTKLEEAAESRRVYEQQSKTLSEPWEGAANITLPLTAITVDNMEPRLVAGLVGQEPYVRLEVEGRKQLSVEEQATEDWFHNELQDVVHLEDVAGDIAHDILLDGTVFAMPTYSIKEKTIRVMQMVDQQALAAGVQQLQMLGQMPPEQMPPEVMQEAQALAQNVAAASQNINGILVDQAGRPQWTDQVVKEFEGGRIEFLKLSDVFLPDDVDDEDYEDAPIIRKVSPYYADLMRDSQDESQEGWITKNINKDLLGEQTEENLDAEEQSPSQEVSDVEVHGRPRVPCIECYLSYMYRKPDENEEDATDFTEERLVALICVGGSSDVGYTGKLLRLRLLRSINPQNNHIIRRLPIYRERGRSLGTSVYYKMLSIQNGASRAFNLAINTGEVNLLPWGFYDGKSGLNKLQGEKGQLQLGIGKMLRVDAVDGILFPQMNGNPAGFVQMLEIWMQFWERSFNIGDLQIGTNQSGSETATASLAKIQEGNIAHNYRSKRSKGGFLGLVQTLWDLYSAWMPLDKTILINGQEAPFPRQLMTRGLKLRLTSSSELANKLIKRRENEDWANITGLVKTPGIFNPVPGAIDLARAYGKDNPEEHVNPGAAQVAGIAVQMPDLVPVMVAAAQQAMALAQQMQQGGEAEAQRGAQLEMQGGGGQAPQNRPPSGEESVKFAPRPQDVVKPVEV